MPRQAAAIRTSGPACGGRTKRRATCGAEQCEARRRRRRESLAAKSLPSWTPVFRRLPDPFSAVALARFRGEYLHFDAPVERLIVRIVGMGRPIPTKAFDVELIRIELEFVDHLFFHRVGPPQR